MSWRKSDNGARSRFGRRKPVMSGQVDTQIRSGLWERLARLISPAVLLQNKSERREGGAVSDLSFKRFLCSSRSLRFSSDILCPQRRFIRTLKEGSRPWVASESRVNAVRYMPIYSEVSSIPASRVQVVNPRRQKQSWYCSSIGPAKLFSTNGVFILASFSLQISPTHRKHCVSK